MNFMSLMIQKKVVVCLKFSRDPWVEPAEKIPLATMGMVAERFPLEHVFVGKSSQLPYITQPGRRLHNHAITRKIHYTWPFLVAMLNYHICLINIYIYIYKQEE